MTAPLLVPSTALAAKAASALSKPSPFRWGDPWLEARLPAPIPGLLTVVGAGTNVGKTFTMLRLARAQAEHGPVVFYSLEDPPREIGRRLAAGLAHPNLYVVFPERNQLSLILTHIEGVCADPTTRPVFVWVDYLQVIGYDGETVCWSKADSVSRIVRDYKACLRACGIPGGVGSQIRRLGPDEQGFPSIHHLKESGDIENQADVVLMLGGKPRSEYVTMELSKAKNAPVGDRQRFRRGAGGVLVPVSDDAPEQAQEASDGEQF